MTPPSTSDKVRSLTNDANDKLALYETTAFNLMAANNHTMAVDILTSAEYSTQKAIYAAGMQVLFDYISQHTASHRNTQRVLIIIVIVTVCIMIPIVMIMSCVTIYFETSMKREIAFVSELLLLDTLHNAVLLKAFEDYCKTEHSEENITCWREIEKYKQLFKYTNKGNKSPSTTQVDSPSVQQLQKEWKQQAHVIWDNYLKPDALKAVNVTDSVRKNVQVSIGIADTPSRSPKTVTPAQQATSPVLTEDIFDSLQAALQQIMTDTHGRFKRTQQFKDAVRVTLK